MEMLLHICCGPCTLYPLKVLRGEGLNVKGYFFNPNIHPFVEFKKRVTSLRSVSLLKSLPVVWDEKGYSIERWLEGLDGVFEHKKRCLRCYDMRMEAAAKRAKELGFHSFSTTLLYSKYQLHEAIRDICEDKAKRYGIEFIYVDFRKGWQEGIDESLRLGIYRQAYCGCIFSERERYFRQEKSLLKKMKNWQGGDWL